jgi:hypothetical protein
MFNMMNRWMEEGNNSPMVCKFLDSLSAFFHEIPRLGGSSSYLLERMDLRDDQSPRFGFRIAFPIWQPALIRLRAGKD